MAATNTQFAVAVHLMAALANQGCGSCTSTYLAGSVNATPSFVRRILAMLSKAGLVKTSRGAAGCCALARPAEGITLLDIYRAVDAPQVFSLHQYPEQARCTVSCRMKSAMGQVLDEAQSRMEASLADRSLASLVAALESSAR